MADNYDYNVIVIGAGSAGLVSSYIAAAVKSRVALIEREKMGGDCLNTGCVPSKSLIRTAKAVHESKKAKELGLKKIDVEFEFSEVMERVSRVIKQIEPHDSVERFEGLGVEVFQGEAKVISANEVQVGDKILTTKNIIIATGAAPYVPPIPGLTDAPYVTSDTIWDIRELPKKLVVIGGGPIGSELSQAMSRLGSEVTVIEGGSQILKKEDPQFSNLIKKRFESEGIKVLTEHSAVEVLTLEDGTHALRCTHNGQSVDVPFSLLLVALGRRARVTGFGLEELGIEINKNQTLEADIFLRTNVPNIYVCGDVTGPYQFTHFGAHQAYYAVVNALFSPFKKTKADYSIVPWCTFTDPEVAHVGLNETEAKKKNVPYKIFEYSFSELDRAITDGDDYGFMRVLVKPGKDTILGVTIAGSRASDLIAEFVLAMKYGLGLSKILSTIHLYPSYPEANKALAGVWKKQTAPRWVFPLLKRYHALRRLF